MLYFFKKNYFCAYKAGIFMQLYSMKYKKMPKAYKGHTASF